MDITYNEILSRVDTTKPYCQGAEITLDSRNGSGTAKVNFDNDTFWINQIVVTGRDATGKVLDTATAREIITATFGSNFKIKYQGGESHEVYSLNKLHENRPNFGWLIPPNSELTTVLQSKEANNAVDCNTFPYKFHIDFKGFVINTNAN